MTLQPFGIIVNPKAGSWDPSYRDSVLEEVKKILNNNCEICGLETGSPEEFQECVKRLSGRVETLIIAGGDGTVTDVINAVPPSQVLAYLPLGSGNGLQHALRLPKNIYDAAECIRYGTNHPVDLVSDGQTKGFITSLGIDGLILQERDKLRSRGFFSYTYSTIKAVKKYKRKTVTLTLDGTSYEIPNTLSIIVTKTPFYGYGLQMIPEAKIDDGRLHVQIINSSWNSILTSLLEKRPIGEHHECLEAKIQSEELSFQIDGNPQCNKTEVNLKVLPKTVMFKY